MVECQLPKLDVAGSTPVSRSIKSIAYEYLLPCSKSVNGLSLVLSTRKLLHPLGLSELCPAMQAG